MYLIGIIVFLVLTTLLMTISAPPMVFLDFPSLLVILGVTVPILLASGLLPDLGKGFRLMTAKENPFSLFELKRIRRPVISHSACCRWPVFWEHWWVGGLAHPSG
jgi:hypothetical protein